MFGWLKRRNPESSSEKEAFKELWAFLHAHGKATYDQVLPIYGNSKLPPAPALFEIEVAYLELLFRATHGAGHPPDAQEDFANWLVPALAKAFEPALPANADLIDLIDDRVERYVRRTSEGRDVTDREMRRIKELDLRLAACHLIPDRVQRELPAIVVSEISDASERLSQLNRVHGASGFAFWRTINDFVEGVGDLRRVDGPTARRYLSKASDR